MGGAMALVMLVFKGNERNDPAPLHRHLTSERAALDDVRVRELADGTAASGPAPVTRAPGSDH